MSAIEIERVGSGSSESRYVYEVLIDGQVRGCVKCGETRIFDVPPGIHTVKLGLDLYNSAPVKVVVGQGKTSLVCRTRQKRRFPFFAAGEPSTRIYVREEAEQVVIPWQQVARPEVAWDHPEKLAAD
jgi:hypothetical protein